MLITTQTEWALAFGAAAGLLTIASNLMKRMVPLRALAMGANVLFVVDGALDANWVLAVLHATLFGVNAFRLASLRRTLVELERARADAPIRDFLLPYMKRRTYRAGDVVFRKGDVANELYYLRRGRVVAPDLGGTTIEAGELFGEIGIFGKEHRRAATLVCATDCVMHTMTDEAVHAMYVQNPSIGFYMIRLVVEHLFAEIQRLKPAAAVEV